MRKEKYKKSYNAIARGVVELLFQPCISSTVCDGPEKCNASEYRDYKIFRQLIKKGATPLSCFMRLFKYRKLFHSLSGGENDTPDSRLSSFATPSTVPVVITS